MSVLHTVTHLFTYENKMDLRTRMKIITKKNDCFQKFIYLSYLFTADGRKREKKPQPKLNSNPTLLYTSWFSLLSTFADQERRCTDLSSLVLSFFTFPRWSKSPHRWASSQSARSRRSPQWLAREAPSSLAEKGTRRFAPLTNWFFWKLSTIVAVQKWP